jgi:hypothetical protein
LDVLEDGFWGGMREGRGLWWRSRRESEENKENEESEENEGKLGDQGEQERGE